MKFLCMDCNHSKICKFRDKYKETMDSVNMKIPTPFDLELKCPHYSTNMNSYYTLCGSDSISGYNSLANTASTCTTLVEALKPSED